MAHKGKLSKKVRYDTLCFHAQQTAEKSLKAILVYYDKPFPRTHDIEELLDLIRVQKVTIPNIVLKAKSLSVHATDSRYPDDFSPEDTVNKEEYKAAVKLAQKVLQWAKAVIKKEKGKLF